jgi:hypothetical protein
MLYGDKCDIPGQRHRKVDKDGLWKAPVEKGEEQAKVFPLNIRSALHVSYAKGRSTIIDMMAGSEDFQQNTRVIRTLFNISA